LTCCHGGTGARLDLGKDSRLSAAADILGKLATEVTEAAELLRKA
jgi:hypothetical protein